MLDGLIFAQAAYSTPSWVDEITNPAGAVFFSVAEDTAVAFLSVLHSGDDIEIRKIGVIEKFRRQGLAQGLIRHAIPLGTRCIIDVSAQNTTALAFYTKLGFSELARRQKYYADGADAIVMQLIK